MIIYMKKTKEVIVVLIGILLMNIKMECIQLVVVVTKDRTDVKYNGGYILYDMKEDNQIYSVTLPLPSTEYFYGYYVTYSDGTGSCSRSG